MPIFFEQVSQKFDSLDSNLQNAASSLGEVLIANVLGSGSGGGSGGFGSGSGIGRREAPSGVVGRTASTSSSASNLSGEGRSRPGRSGTSSSTASHDTTPESPHPPSQQQQQPSSSFLGGLKVGPVFFDLVAVLCVSQVDCRMDAPTKGHRGMLR